MMMATMMIIEVNLYWVVFWVLFAVGWSFLSFQWLIRSVAAIKVPVGDEKPNIGILVLRRFAVFFVVALLFYLAIKTEPIAAVAMAITMTIATWVQVLSLNKKVKKQEEHKEKELGRDSTSDRL